MNIKEISFKICANNEIYNKFFLQNTLVSYTNNDKTSVKSASNISKAVYTLRLNGLTLHYLIKGIINCEVCEKIFLNYILNIVKVNRVKINLLPLDCCPDTIDYNWNEKICLMVRERSELDHALSWLSTLGGAFSALGDYFVNCAETAAKISVHQFQLALRLGDPDIASRCRLYFSLSLIQRKEYRQAYWIISREYRHANSATICDKRLIKMCKGIYAKLKYEWEIHKRRKTKKVKF